MSTLLFLLVRSLWILRSSAYSFAVPCFLCGQCLYFLVYLLSRCLMLNWSRRHAFIYATKTWNLWVFFLKFFECFRGKIYKKILQEMKNGLSLRHSLDRFISSLPGKSNAPRKKRTILLFFFTLWYRDFPQATILKRRLLPASVVHNRFLILIYIFLYILVYVVIHSKQRKLKMAITA